MIPIFRNGSRCAGALDIARQDAEALEAAREKGVVHRDLKPANVKVTPAKLFTFAYVRCGACFHYLSSRFHHLQSGEP